MKIGRSSPISNKKVIIKLYGVEVGKIKPLNYTRHKRVKYRVLKNMWRALVRFHIRGQMAENEEDLWFCKDWSYNQYHMRSQILELRLSLYPHIKKP